MRDSAKALLAEVARSRDEFEAKWQGRAELLGRRYAIFRFCQHYRTVSARFERRFHRPMRAPAKVQPITGTAADWRSWDFTCDDKGRPYPTVANIMAALEYAPGCANLIKYDPQAKKYWLMGTIPGDWWTENVAPIIEPRFLNTEDVTQIRAYLEGPTVGLVGITHDDVLAAVRAVGKRFAFGGEL